MKKLIIVLIVAMILSTVVYAQSSEKYSGQEVKDDLKYMYETLEKSNYDQYALVKKEEMDRAYNTINSSITDSLTSIEIYRLFQPFVAKAGMSHCNLSKPWGEYVRILKQESTFFPILLHFSKGKS